jgi:TetR/AcrR family transcriptional regulator, regulator of autoinduction and epiphytic fitness
MTKPAEKISFKAQMLQAREEAIVRAVNALLAEKGFDGMTVDDVASRVGIAKASLYKHFPGKDDLAAAAMVWVMRRTQAHMASLAAGMAAMDKLKAVVAWAIALKLAGEMPALPSQNSSLRKALSANRDYMEALVEVSDELGAWIVEAQKKGAIDPTIPPIVVLYTLYARACDPVVEFLQLSGQFGAEEIQRLVMKTCFEGLARGQA